MEKKRVYKYDNVKALLIFLVVVGHMTTDYVSDSHLVRWVTLWIYSFHMPAFIFISGLVHKQYITEERASLGEKGETRMRWDKVLGFFLCGYALKVFLQFSRTLMGQNPLWHWIEEPGIPWYLFVMAEYEILLYVIRRIDGGRRRGGAESSETAFGSVSGANRVDASVGSRKTKGLTPAIMIAAAFILSAAIGYFPAIGDAFCLSRMINFLPIYMLGYYMDMRKFLVFIDGSERKTHYDSKAENSVNDAAGTSGITKEGNNTNNSSNIPNTTGNKTIRIVAWTMIAASLVTCYFLPWGGYSLRKWFTGRRSYEFLSDFFGSTAMYFGWAIRIAVWAFAILLTLAVIAVVPDRDLGFITTVGARTLNVYFWHRPLCYLFRNWAVLPRLCVLFGGTYNEAAAGAAKGLAFGGSSFSILAAFVAYILIAAAMTALFSLRIFEHPCSDIMRLSAKPFSSEEFLKS